MQPTPVFLPGKPHGWRSLVGYYSPWGHKELDTTERIHSLTHKYINIYTHIHMYMHTCTRVYTCMHACSHTYMHIYILYIWKWKWKLLSHVQLLLTPWTIHGILQARILEWVAFPCSMGSSQPRNQTRVSCITGGFFANWAVREARWSGFPISLRIF